MIPTLPLPNRGSKRAAASADQMLEAILSDRDNNDADAPMEGAPAWAVAVNQGIMHRFSRLEDTHEVMGSRLASLEQSRSEERTRVKALEEKMEILQGQLGEMSKREQDAPRTSAPADPWANYFSRVPPPVSLQAPSGTSASQRAHTRDEIDYSHLILGGWARDTKRQIVRAEVEEFVQRFQVPDCNRTAVYGKRCRVAHCYLKPLPAPQAKERFFRFLEAANKSSVLPPRLRCCGLVPTSHWKPDCRTTA